MMYCTSLYIMFDFVIWANKYTCMILWSMWLRFFYTDHFYSFTVPEFHRLFAKKLHAMVVHANNDTLLKVVGETTYSQLYGELWLVISKNIFDMSLIWLYGNLSCLCVYIFVTQSLSCSDASRILEISCNNDTHCEVNFQSILSKYNGQVQLKYMFFTNYRAHYKACTYRVRIRSENTVWYLSLSKFVVNFARKGEERIGQIDYALSRRFSCVIIKNIVQ